MRWKDIILGIQLMCNRFVVCGGIAIHTNRFSTKKLIASRLHLYAPLRIRLQPRVVWTSEERWLETSTVNPVERINNSILWLRMEEGVGEQPFKFNKKFYPTVFFAVVIIICLRKYAETATGKTNDENLNVHRVMKKLFSNTKIDRTATGSRDSRCNNFNNITRTDRNAAEKKEKNGIKSAPNEY